MPRLPRASVGGMCYHVLNRSNANMVLFRDAKDYQMFDDLIRESCDRLPMRILAWCIMPTHFHFVLWPREDGDVSRWMQWLLTTHVRRYHWLHSSSGHIWQGRFRDFPIQQNQYLVSLLKFVERNPLRSGLVTAAEKWEWSSLKFWNPKLNRPNYLFKGSIKRPEPWIPFVNEPQDEKEEEGIQLSIRRGSPWGNTLWVHRTAEKLGILSTLRPRGRPRKDAPF